MPNINVQTDSDAESQFQIGVGKSDQIGRALHQINPNWVEDGYGIIGPQRPKIPREEPRRNPTGFGVDNARPPLQSNSQCTPSGPPSTGTWVWGTVDGVCQWIDTTEC